MGKLSVAIAFPTEDWDTSYGPKLIFLSLFFFYYFVHYFDLYSYDYVSK